MDVQTINNMYGLYIMAGLICFCLILLILCIVSLVKVSRLKKRVNSFMRTNDENNIEQMLNEYLNKTEAVDAKYQEAVNSIKDINNRLSFCLQKVGLVRYNPFDNVGGDLCFTLALLDEKNCGVVINTIFSRESSYTYAKPIKNGESTYTLSNEEKQAISLAIQTNK